MVKLKSMKPSFQSAARNTSCMQWTQLWSIQRVYGMNKDDIHTASQYQ